MHKYRRLNKEELVSLEQEFIEFLVLNGITAEDWVGLKKDNPEKVEKIISLFSDVVFEKILRKTNYLEMWNEHQVIAYQCLKTKLVAVGIRNHQGNTFNFLDKEKVTAAINHPPEGIEIFTSEKEYLNNRESELFKMIQSGCQTSDGKLFKTLCLVL